MPTEGSEGGTTSQLLDWLKSKQAVAGELRLTRIGAKLELAIERLQRWQNARTRDHLKSNSTVVCECVRARLNLPFLLSLVG